MESMLVAWPPGATMRTHKDGPMRDVPNESSNRSRREFLSNAAILTAGLSFGCANGMERALAPDDRPESALSTSSDDEDESDGRLPAPEASGIEHIVLVMMENRSFDHFLGWLPGANGRQAGLLFTDRDGVPPAPYPPPPAF